MTLDYIGKIGGWEYNNIKVGGITHIFETIFIPGAQKLKLRKE